MGIRIAATLALLPTVLLQAMPHSSHTQSIFTRQEPAPLSEWPAIPEPTARRPRRILVVEDNVDAAQTLAMLIDLLGHHVRVAHTGTEGVREALDWRPHAVICDIGLPGLDGYGVAEQLRSHPETRTAVLIALTGYGTEEDVRRAKEAGFNYHITKPADPAALLGLLWANEQ